MSGLSADTKETIEDEIAVVASQNWRHRGAVLVTAVGLEEPPVPAKDLDELLEVAKAARKRSPFGEVHYQWPAVEALPTE